MKVVFQGASWTLVDLYISCCSTSGGLPTSTGYPTGVFVCPSSTMDCRVKDLRSLQPPSAPSHTPVYTVFLQLGTDDAKCL